MKLIFLLLLVTLCGSCSCCPNSYGCFPKCGQSNYPQGELDAMKLFQDAKPGQFPFAARLILDEDNDNTNETDTKDPNKRPHHCNAFIVGQRRLVTARDCVVDAATEKILPNLRRAIVGDHNLDDPNDGGYAVELDEIISRPNNTTAVLVLKEPLAFKLPADNRGAVNSVCLPEDNSDIKAGDKLYFVAWSDQSRNLQVTRVEMGSLSECSKLASQLPASRANATSEATALCIKSGRPLSDRNNLGGVYVRQLDNGRYEMVSFMFEGLLRA